MEEDMKDSRIEQPDALNAPIAFNPLPGTIDRLISGVAYTYKLYRSNDMIACDDDKRITIK